MTVVPVRKSNEWPLEAYFFRAPTLNELWEAGVPLIVNLKVSENTIDLNANENLEEIAEKDVDDNDFQRKIQLYSITRSLSSTFRTYTKHNNIIFIS